MKTFVMSQFCYCPLNWMFHDRSLNNETNKFSRKDFKKLHTRTMSLV